MSDLITVLARFGSAAITSADIPCRTHGVLKIGQLLWVKEWHGNKRHGRLTTTKVRKRYLIPLTNGHCQAQTRAAPLDSAFGN
jgi:hypothetical protein